MKTLNNCTPREFMRQLSRIREASRSWLDLTQLQQLRRRMPPARAYKDDNERIAAVMTQWRTNIKDMLNAALMEHPDETIELLGLLCFIEPEDLDNHEMSELFAGFMDVLNNDKLLELFTVLLSVFTPRIMSAATAPTTTGEAADAATSAAAAAPDPEMTPA